MVFEGSKIVRLELGNEELRVRQRLRRHKILAVGFEFSNHVVIGPVLEITQYNDANPIQLRTKVETESQGAS